MEQTQLPIKYQEAKTQEIQVKMKSHSSTKRKVKTWTPEEDKKLRDIYSHYPKKWNKISELMGNRNENQCLHRFRRLSQLGHNKKIWSQEQDQTVLQMVEKYGSNWKLIASALKTKSGKQIRERYINKLDPKIKKQEWTQKQDIKLIQLYSKYGSKWSQISQQLPGRPQNRIKNRFYSYIQKNYDITIKEDSGRQHPTAQTGDINSPISQEQPTKSKVIASFDISATSNMLFTPPLKQGSNKSASSFSNASNSAESLSCSKSNKFKIQMDQQLKRPVFDFNKENKQFEKCQKLQRILSKKSIDQEWIKERSLQQINEPNQLAYTLHNDHDFFYFQDN